MRQRFPSERIVLHLIAAVGIIALVAIAPGLGVVFKRYGYKKKLQRTYVPTVLHRLHRKGLIIYDGEGTARRVHITAAGKKHLEEKRLAFLYRPQKRRWDGYWRIVMFDIPERLKIERHQLRNELREVGFKKLQASVWVSPDECEEYIKLLKADRRLGKYVIYLKTKDLEYGASLARLFSIERR